MKISYILLLDNALHAGALMLCFAASGIDLVLGMAPRRRQRLLIIGAGMVVAFTALAWVPLVAAVVYDDPRSATDPVSISTILLHTGFGRIWLAHIVTIGAALAWTILREGAVGGAGRMPSVVLWGLALGGLGFIGHAGGVEGTKGLLQCMVLSVHLLATGAWVGALPWLGRLAYDASTSDLARCLRRFSPVGMVLVALVVASGLLSAYWRTGTLASLRIGGYGAALAGKLSLLALMGACALLNRNVYTPALERAGASKRMEFAGRAYRRLRRGLLLSLAAETALGALAVLLAAWLAQAEAPR